MSETETTSEPDVEAALAAGLLGIDSARRVGWAKAFDALRRVESLEEEVRQTRDELKWLRRAYSHLLGFVTTIPIRPTDILRKEMASHLEAEQTFRHDDAWNLGIARGWDHKAQLHGWDREKRDKIRANRSQRSNGLFKAAAAAGHTTEFDRLAVPLVVSCSCGMTSGIVESWEMGYQWRQEHWTQAVHGLSFSEWVKKFDPDAPSYRVAQPTPAVIRAKADAARLRQMLIDKGIDPDAS